MNRQATSDTPRAGILDRATEIRPSPSQSVYRRALLSAAVFLTVLGCWGTTVWLAHEVRPWAIRLTNYFFGVGLGIIYAGGWTMAAIWLPGRHRRIVFRAVGTSLLLLLLVAILEAPALVGLLNYSTLWKLASGEWSEPENSFIADDELVFRRPPHTAWSGRPRSDMAMFWNLPVRAPSVQSFTTDSKGFRNPRERDRADIALIGDSYVEGAYVSDEETCAIALEQLTGRPVANLGQSGYGTLQELEILQRYALGLAPRMVAWFFFEGNDLYDDQEFENALLGLRERGSSEARESWRFSWRKFQRTSFSCNSFRLLRRLCHPLVPISVTTSGWFRDDQGQQRHMLFYDDATLCWTEFESERFDKTKAAFRRGQQLCQEQDIRLVLVFVPMKFRVYGDRCTYPPYSPCQDWQPWDLPARFTEFCADEGIELLDLTIPMRCAAAIGQVLYAPEDTHWNREGHAFVAELLRDWWDRLGQDDE